MTGLEIASSVPAITDWRIHPWIPEGTITEISGKIKVAGKTTFAAVAVRHVLDGAPFLGGSYTNYLKTPTIGYHRR
jgi:AAA domain